jgi:DNA invertase Pin-like site-specific DNA recombinase
LRPKAFSYLRMSTDLQLKGDSRRRQLEASRAYVEAHNLDIADDAQLEDIGVSAFRGANVSEGSLGGFLRAVKQGKVARGSYLIVESLDRLSRQEILTAHGLFLGIVQAGINLVTLIDGRTHRAGETNLGDLIMSLVIMRTAHEESQKKSVRISAAWKNKRSNAVDGKPMTARCPAWLRLSADRTSYEVISDRAEIVRKVFEETIAGVGMYSVANRLNEAGVPAFVGKNGWHQSYIAKTLANRAVIGEFQPHVKLDGDRLPSGEPIKNYFPAIIADEMFYRAQNARSERKQSGSGRKGASFTNLFSRLAVCAYCRSTIAFENKGEGAKGGSYLVCDSAKRHRGCQATRWRYKDFEASFLAFVQEIDVEAMINQDDESEKRRALESEVSAIEGELLSIEALMLRTFEVLATGAAIDFVSSRLRELESCQRDLKVRLRTKRHELELLNNRISTFYESKNQVRGFVERLQKPSGEELFKLRAQIASRIKNLVQTLVVAPLGDRPKTEKAIDYLRGETGADDVISLLAERLSSKKDDRRYFAVGFRNGTVRAVYPSAEDPLHYEQQLLATDGRFMMLNPGEPVVGWPDAQSR